MGSLLTSHAPSGAHGSDRRRRVRDWFLHVLLERGVLVSPARLQSASARLQSDIYRFCFCAQVRRRSMHAAVSVPGLCQATLGMKLSCFIKALLASALGNMLRSWQASALGVRQRTPGYLLCSQSAACAAIAAEAQNSKLTPICRRAARSLLLGEQDVSGSGKTDSVDGSPGSLHSSHAS